MYNVFIINFTQESLYTNYTNRFTDIKKEFDIANTILEVTNLNICNRKVCMYNVCNINVYIGKS